MFGLFKKKQPKTMLDDVIETTYGKAKKTANLNAAIEMTYKDILLELISKKEITKIATGLFEGPMPYSTEDLAFAVALNFYKRPENKELLEETQLIARMKMLECIQGGKVNPMFASAFENTLYKLYK